MEAEEFERIVADVREQFQREIDQGVLKRDLYQCVEALGGRDACDRILHTLALRAPHPAPLRAVRGRNL